MSNSGYATFTAMSASSNYELRRGNGGPAVTMASLELTGAYGGFIGDAPVNDSGDALLSLLRRPDNRAVIARYSGSTLTPIAVNNLAAPGNPYSPFAMNALGTGLYGADGADADPFSDELLTVSNSGSPVSRFTLGTSFTRFLHGDVNNANVITFTAVTTGGSFALCRETGPNQYETLLETPLANGYIEDSYAAESGLMLTRAVIDGGALSIYVLDPETRQLDPILAVGQSFANSTIAQLSVGEWNGSGQIPIALKLANGTEMIVRADPVPEPAAIGLMLCVAIAVTRRRDAR